MVVAFGRPLGVAIDVAVADCHTVVGALSKNNVLATNASRLTNFSKVRVSLEVKNLR